MGVAEFQKDVLEIEGGTAPVFSGQNESGGPRSGGEVGGRTATTPIPL